MPTKRSATPRYVQVAADLRRRIVEDREWRPGEPLPPHRALMTEYKASHTLMTNARRLLIEEGLLEARSSAGTFVRNTPDRRQTVRTDWGGRLAPLRQQEDPAGAIDDWDCRSQTITAGRELAAQLDIPLGGQVMETDYQFRSGGVLVRLTRTYEPYSVVGGTPIVLPEDGPLAGRSVIERMAGIGITGLEAVDELISRVATAPEAQLLGGGGPVLEVSRLYRGADERPVHLERTVVRGDRGAMVYRLTADR